MLAAHVESITDCQARRFCSSLMAWFCSGCHGVPSVSSSSNSTLWKSSGPLPSISSGGDLPWTETVSEKALHTRDARVWHGVVDGT